MASVGDIVIWAGDLGCVDMQHSARDYMASIDRRTVARPPGGGRHGMSVIANTIYVIGYRNM